MRTSLAVLVFAAACHGQPSRTLAETIAIKTKGDTASALLPKGTRLPASHAEVFSTELADQGTFGVQLIVGDANKASANRSLLDVAVPLEHRGPAGVPQIDFTIKVDAAGKITVDANERGGSGAFHRDDLVVAID